jgi:uncharacterized protein YjbI with pentapeptide repeats
MLNSKSLGNKIAEARKKNNFSQAELAQKVSISAQAVGKWERGESMPDITTLSRLAEVFGVDLNYFSERFQSTDTESNPSEPIQRKSDTPPARTGKKFDWNWDMSRGNWSDADFSGLKNLKEKFSSSNLKNCKFISSDLSGLLLSSNNIEVCDFTSSDLRNSKIKSSNLLKDQFNNCSFIDAGFSSSNIEKCDFTQANFSGAEFSYVNFENSIIKDAIWKFTIFKKTNLSNLIFEGNLEDCHFENCSFYGVKFENATILNSFFKYNQRFKKVQFINCKVDSITYAFLKNNQADMTGIELIS